MQRRLRLSEPADFERLRRDGKAYHHSLLTLSVASNERGYNRYGFIVMKRLGPAVTRNRVRRLLRETVRLLDPRLQAGFDIVIIARRGAVDQPFALIQQVVESLMADAKLLLVESDER